MFFSQFYLFLCFLFIFYGRFFCVVASSYEHYIWSDGSIFSEQIGLSNGKALRDVLSKRAVSIIIFGSVTLSDLR